jgi:hypothetical protein
VVRYGHTFRHREMLHPVWTYPLPEATPGTSTRRNRLRPEVHVRSLPFILRYGARSRKPSCRCRLATLVHAYSGRHGSGCLGGCDSALPRIQSHICDARQPFPRYTSAIFKTDDYSRSASRTNITGTATGRLELRMNITGTIAAATHRG